MIAAEYADTGIKPWRFSVSDYRIMGKHGFWRPDERVELFDGILINLPAPSEAHEQVSARLTTLLQRGSGKPWQVRVAKALQLSDLSEFLPDLVLLKRRNYGRAIPTAADVLVAIEIADDRTLETDRQAKLPIYAAAGIPEYWIVQLRYRWIARYDKLIDDEYGQLYTFKEHETLTSAVLPMLRLSVAAIVGSAVTASAGEDRG